MKKQNLGVLISKILAIGYIFFFTMFSFDVELFSLGFFVHLIPSFILIVVLVIAWKNNKSGGLLFLLTGLVFTLYFHTFNNWLSLFLISGPLLVVGCLFLYNTRTSKAA